jgi:hypothetical protein
MNNQPDNQHTISMTDSPNVAVSWLNNHGVRASYMVAGPDGTGIVFDNGPGTPALIALPGDTLTRLPNGTVIVT